MVRHGLIEDGLLCTAYVRWKVTDSAARRFDRLAKLDVALIDLLREESPDAESGHWLSLRRINQRLLDAGHESDPDALRRLLKSLEWDGRGMAGSRGSIELRYVARDHYQVRLQRTWDLLSQTAERRRSVARVALNTIVGRVPAGQPPGADVPVSFSLVDIARAVDEDLVLRVQGRDTLKAIERALTFLHEQKVILLQQGLAVFRQAMVIRIRPESHGRGYTVGNHEGLAHHFVVRRVAWLVRVKRVPPRSILVVAFNRSAVLEVRRRCDTRSRRSPRPSARRPHCRRS